MTKFTPYQATTTREKQATDSTARPKFATQPVKRACKTTA